MASSIYVVAAMAGNFWQESTLNPALWQTTPHSFTSLLNGYGLGQWTNTGGDTHGRLYQLYQYLTSHGYSLTSGNAQCEYVVYENVWYPTQEAAAFPNLTAFLNSDSTDLTALTHAWNRGWEGIHDETWDLRVTYANQAYNYILEHWNDPNITEWKTSNTYLSNADRYNNSVMLYRYFGSDVPPHPGPGGSWLYGGVRDVLRRLIIHA